MAYFNNDDYDSGVSGEQGPVTRDMMADSICPDCGKEGCECVVFTDGSKGQINDDGILVSYAKHGGAESWGVIAGWTAFVLLMLSLSAYTSHKGDASLDRNYQSIKARSGKVGE